MNISILDKAEQMGIFNGMPVVERLKNRLCPTCGADLRNPQFKDALSEKEFMISGMCQKCQDSVFNPEE